MHIFHVQKLPHADLHLLSRLQQMTCMPLMRDLRMRDSLSFRPKHGGTGGYVARVGSSMDVFVWRTWGGMRYGHMVR
jgi:hypothetical protein